MSTSARIVVGVDGSPASTAALRWAARQAELTGSRLEAVTAWERPATYGGELLWVDDVDWAAMADATLEAAIGESGDDGSDTWRRVVTEGHPSRVLVQASVGADLLVVGSRGHGGFTALLLGSVGEHVVAHAACPVLVVPHAQQTSPPAAGAHGASVLHGARPDALAQLA